MTQGKRRDFLFTATKVAGAVCVVGAAWPVLKSFGPTADELPRYETFALSKLQPGQQVTLKVGGIPHFLRHLTVAEIRAARDVPLSELRDQDARNDNHNSLDDDPRFLSETASVRRKATVENRLIDPARAYLLLLGVCPFRGCVLRSGWGEDGGWVCPCHGSGYDVLGRFLTGPSLQNLSVPKAWIEGDMLFVPYAST